MPLPSPIDPASILAAAPGSTVTQQGHTFIHRVGGRVFEVTTTTRIRELVSDSDPDPDPEDWRTRPVTAIPGGFYLGPGCVHACRYNAKHTTPQSALACEAGS